MYILWMIWNNRNDCVHNLKCKNPSTLGLLAVKLAEDFKEYNTVGREAGQRNTEDWLPPPRRNYKLNVDASYDSASRKASFGAVLRDASSKVQIAAVSKVEDVDSPLQAELMAILFGLQVTSEQEFKEILVESDCLLAVQEILRRQDSLCEWGSILMDIQDRSLEFNQCSFRHINRFANVLAHNLSKVYCEVGEHNIWRNSLPPSMCNPIYY